MALDLTRYPNGDDIVDRMKAVDFWPHDAGDQAYGQIQADINAAAAATDFENQTGWAPFLSPADFAVETRTFEFYDEYALRRALAGGVLVLNGGLLELTGCTVNGTTQTIGQSVYLRPSDALNRRRPYTNLFFPFFLYNRHSSFRHLNIQVTGRWGFCTTVPADAWYAIASFGAANSLADINVIQDTASISQNGFSKSWDIVGTITPKDLLAEWPKQYKKVVDAYRRQVVR